MSMSIVYACPAVIAGAYATAVGQVCTKAIKAACTVARAPSTTARARARSVLRVKV